MTETLSRLNQSPDLVDQVYRALLDAIRDGSLAPGLRLTQEDIAQRLAVSRQPVLQALRLLKKDGLVMDAPGRGLQVTPLDPQVVGQVYQVRGALDALAARLAAQQQYRIAPALIAQGRKAAAGRDIDAMIEADIAFHAAIYEGSGNPLIAQSAQLHWHHVRRVMGAVLQTTPQRESLWDEHQAIADAIADGDADTAGRLIDEHSRRASDALGRQLDAMLKPEC
ncbi:MAG: GntR family transcriptional regulator [Quisquiliibacterium sp.]|jgi:DNA-binding GntR family transcriptional regulator